MGLREQLRRLKREAQADTLAVVCPECGQRFLIHEDTYMDLIVHEWTEATGEKGHWEPSPDLLRLLAHEHDASLFLDEDGRPWLGTFFYGASQELREYVEDLSEP